MATDKRVENFVINKVESKDVYDSMVSQGLINEDELYLIPSDGNENGATFTPNVSADGTLSWTNDGELPNPAPVNIKGPKGDAGHTPVKGTDYWTVADKQELVNSVLAALPTWTGGSY